MQTIQLQNGLRVLLAPSEGTNTVTVLVLVRVGSRYESKKVSGVSHFIEHLLFKGTKKRPTAQHISRALDMLGAEFNAFTDKHVTGYYIKVDQSALTTALDILSDMIFHSKFDPKEVNRERSVVIEEINMYQDAPMRHVEDLLEEAVYAGTTLGWNIAGTPKTMKDMKQEDILSYYKEYYQPSTMVIAVAGNFQKDASSLIEKYFGSAKDAKIPPTPFVPFANKNRLGDAPYVRIQNKKTEQIQVALGFPSFGIDDQRNVALGLLSVILGGNMSSRLFVEVRERRGLAYFVRAANSVYDDVGVYSIRAGLDKKRLPLAMKTIVSELKKVTRTGVTAEELKNAKTFLHGQLSIRMEDSFDRAEWFAKQAMFKEIRLTPQEYLVLVDMLTSDDLKRVAKEIFVMSRMSVAVVGPYKTREEFLKKAGL